MALQTLDDLVVGTGNKLPETISVSKAQLKTILQAAFADLKEITDAGNSVRIHNFGTFSSRTRSARTGRNPATGEAIQIPESVTLGFKPTKHSK